MDDELRLRKKDAKKLRRAAELIDAVLCWEDTPEGHDYWAGVYYSLMAKATARSAGVAAGSPQDDEEGEEVRSVVPEEATPPAATDSQEPALAPEHALDGRLLSRRLRSGSPVFTPVRTGVPDVGAGYREATPDDAFRLDREGYLSMLDTLPGWYVVKPNTFIAGVTYRVPVDRVPTDEDARQRPTVMVRDTDCGNWLARTLLYVNHFGSRFVVRPRQMSTSWALCRFPYPGELEAKNVEEA